MLPFTSRTLLREAAKASSLSKQTCNITPLRTVFKGKPFFLISIVMHFARSYNKTRANTQGPFDERKPKVITRAQKPWMENTMLQGRS
jgi:hypothetical protein